MSARSLPLRRDAAAAAKSGFAKRAAGFAKRTVPRRMPPGFSLLWIGAAAAAGLMTVTGGFGTGVVPLPARGLFWALLMTWNALKWQLWFATMVREPRDWMRAALIGAVLLTLPLPLEIFVTARAAGIAAAMPDALGTWGRGLAIGALVFVTLRLILHATGHHRLAWLSRTPVAPQPGLLARAHIVPGALLAIEAEDHYCRVHRSDGPSALIHYRFGDALDEVGAIEGAQVHRGAWVAAGAFVRAQRDGRRWRLVLADGTAIPVSATYAPEARRRGWLRTG